MDTIPQDWISDNKNNSYNPISILQFNKGKLK